jgi:hypothetical protein
MTLPRRGANPSEVGWLVAHLVSWAAGRSRPMRWPVSAGSPCPAMSQAGSSRWPAFPASAKGEEQIRLGAFRIALAVLNETPFDLVAEAEGLTEQILITRSPRREGGGGETWICTAGKYRNRYGSG